MNTDSFPHNLGRGEKFAVFALMGTAAVIVFGSLFGLLVQYLWNATLVSLLGVSEMAFWQAIGVLILAKLFFGFGSGPSRSSSGRRRKSRDSDRDKGRGRGRDRENETERDEQAFTKEQAFRDFWEREGKAAYQAYKSSRDVSADD